MAHPWTADFRWIAAALAMALPFLSLVLILLFTRKWPRLSAGLSITAIGISTILAVLLLIRDRHMETPVQYTVKWIAAGHLVLPFGFLFDPLNLLMFTLVAFISLLVQLYSLGYMAGDPGFSRYYAFQSLFSWSMLSLCLSSSLLQLYVFWELVGLSSYFLIGFWYERFSATQAGKKAFVMTRLGDTGFLIGLLLLLAHVGDLDILHLSAPETLSRITPGFATLASLLIFCAVVGKSAQFPLLTWLPDAMEGPTPVSALLHSATMVAAGVFLFARLLPFFSLSPTAMTIFLAIGTISMLMASTMAMVQRDIKQVWAYSTISQLGMMIMGLGAGALFAGVFHLTAHAGFKALLFLCSGVWIHHFATNDVFSIAEREGRRSRVATVCLVVGAGALAGLPPFSGFFSKEAIMGILAGLRNPVWLAAGLLGVFMTSYYAFRMVFILLFPKERSGSAAAGPLADDPSGRIEAETQTHAGHGSIPHHDRDTFAQRYRKANDSGLVQAEREGDPPVMNGPLLALALFTLLLGFFRGPLERFLGTRAGGASPEGGSPWLVLIAIGLSVFGLFLSWFEYGRRGASQVGFLERIPAVRKFFEERWYLDRVYGRFVRVVLDGVLAGLSFRNERQVIDRSIDRFSRFTLWSGRGSSFLQSGLLRYNLALMLAVLIIVALCFSFL